MHIFFSGIGGTAIGPLALIAKQAGYTVSGSDARESNYVTYLRQHGINDIYIGQTEADIAKAHAKQPIDWYVYSAAIAIEQPDGPEFSFCKQHAIRTSMRDELLNTIITDKGLKLIAIAGTHGKTTTTAMAIWLFKELGIPASYSVGAKLSFGEMGQYDPTSEYFIYEADEFARNFLAFHPHLSLITGVDWDHPDIYPTRESYDQAFQQFATQSRHIVAWQSDVAALKLTPPHQVLADDDPEIEAIKLPGHVNRRNAWQVAQSVSQLTGKPLHDCLQALEHFPGVSRRFEQLAPNLITDYAHTPPKIRGALQLAHEIAGDNVVVVYEGLHNMRQHFIRDELNHLFDSVKRLYIVPTYLAREDPKLKIYSTAELEQLMSDKTREHSNLANLNENLQLYIQEHLILGDLVLCLTAGGAGSLDEWLRKNFL